MVQQPQDKKSWFFVDESGDPAFYGKGGRVIVGEEGCSKVFMVGFVAIDEPDTARNEIQSLRDEISKDSYLKGIPSMEKSLVSFHAKDDCPEVKMLVYKTLAKLDFSAHVIVARKFEPMFCNKYEGNQDRFYDDMVARLFQNQLHKATHNTIVFSRRGNKRRQHALRAALQKGVDAYNARWEHDISTKIDVLTYRPSEDPLLQVVDYANWAVQRAYHRQEMRYFEVIRDKYSLILDVFDQSNYKGGGNYYSRDRNPFDIKKASPLD